MNANTLTQLVEKGNIFGSTFLLVEMNRELFLRTLEKQNPKFYNAYKEDLESFNNQQLAEVVSIAIKGGAVVLSQPTKGFLGGNTTELAKDVIKSLNTREEIKTGVNIQKN